MNTQGDPQAVRALAHRLWEQRGREEGHALEDWLAAERQLLGATPADSTEVTIPPAHEGHPLQPEIPKLASGDAPGG